MLLATCSIQNHQLGIQEEPILFDDEESIKQLKFKIEDIERDVQSGLLNGMWTYSFRDREGNIQKGQLFGEGDINNDPIFGLTVGAPRNVIGIKKMLNAEETKMRITRNGSITFYMKDADLATELQIQDIIEGFLQYGSLS